MPAPVEFFVDRPDFPRHIIIVSKGPFYQIRCGGLSCGYSINLVAKDNLQNGLYGYAPDIRKTIIEILAASGALEILKKGAGYG